MISYWVLILVNYLIGKISSSGSVEATILSFHWYSYLNYSFLNSYNKKMTLVGECSSE
jgi:hypothetical protein